MIDFYEAGKLAKLMMARRPRQGGMTDADLEYLQIMSEAGDWTYKQAERAFIEHSSNHPGEFFEPGHITQRVTEVRRQISARWYCPDPPRELADDPKAEIKWRQNAAHEFVERNLALWAAGESFEDVAEVLGIENEKRGELPGYTSGDSSAKRAAMEEIRRFSQRTRMPKPLESDEQSPEALQQAREELRRKKWEAVDACNRCDDEGMVIDSGVVCDHTGPIGDAA